MAEFFNQPGLFVGILIGIVLCAAILGDALRRCSDVRRRAEYALAQEHDRVVTLRGELIAGERELATAGERMATQAAQTVVLREALARAEVTAGRLPELEKRLAERAREAEIEESALRKSLEILREKLAEALRHNEVLRVQMDAVEKRAQDKWEVLTETQASMGEQFRTLANDIMEEKSQRFTDQNRKNIDQLLGPLKERIGVFEKQIRESYAQESKDRSALAQEVRQLKELNLQISDDAVQLTNALKGEAKQRGDWGEMVLEKILDLSGLERGREYETQQMHKDAVGGRFHPDVIVHLPGERDIVIDAKVALNDYAAFFSADGDAERQQAMRSHIAALKRHVRELSEKRYHQLEGVRSLEFVLMFVPVEGAFIEACRADQGLYGFAATRNVVIVTASTMLATLRTIAGLWRHEQQHRNAEKIAKRATALYEKFAGFVDDLVAVGRRLDQARDAQRQALSKLQEGRGNLLWQSEQLIALGVKPARPLSKEVSDS